VGYWDECNRCETWKRSSGYIPSYAERAVTHTLVIDLKEWMKMAITLVINVLYNHKFNL
jgi:hypothetical protein